MLLLGETDELPVFGERELFRFLQRGLGTGEAGAKVGVLRFFLGEPAEVKHGGEPLPRRFRFRCLSTVPAPGVESTDPNNAGGSQRFGGVVKSRPSFCSSAQRSACFSMTKQV